MTKSSRTPVDSEFLDLGSPTEIKPQRVAASRKGMVSTQHFLATEVGAEILADGGNAFDAAVAVAIASGICEPAASGLGGQTHALIHDAENNRTIAFDGSSRAPNRAHPGALKKKERRLGHRASTVPSTPAVMAHMLEHYGTMPWKRVLEPAIRIARDGYPITDLQHRLLKRERSNLLRGNAGMFFLRDGKRSYRPGDTFKQPVLAGTLERLADAGAEDFYRGDIAQVIHTDMTDNGGFVQEDDLAQIPWPIERLPIRCRFRKRRVYTFPPPGGGNALIEMLNVLSRLHRDIHDARDLDSPHGALVLAEMIRQANIDRQDRPFEPNYYPQIRTRKVIGRKHAEEVAAQIHRRIETSGETTHFSIMDSKGNTVALTQSIERVYGAKVASPELGFLYNNWMSAFDYEDITHPYYMRPNAVPWSSAAPTIVFEGDRPWLAIGSPGSERIISAIVQVLLRLPSESPFDAVEAPRLHSNIDGLVSLEASRMRDDVTELLEERGFTIDRRDPYAFYLGSVQLVLNEDGLMTGVADPRRDGAAKGPR